MKEQIPCLVVDDKHKTNPRTSLKVLCLITCEHTYFPPCRSFAHILWLLFGVCVRFLCVSVSACVSCTFSLVLFLLCVCFVLFWFVCFCFILFYFYSSDASLFPKKRQKGCESWWYRNGMRNWWEWGKKGCNQNMLYEKNYFSIK